jgi:glycosyltransferase involved in cell wall biosynthesis
MREHLLAIVPASLRERFVFEGRATRHDIAKMYADCTVACLPSVWENFPFTCQEALALGTPFVGSAAGGMSEIIEDGVSGLLTRGGEGELAVSDLADKLARMIKEPSLRRACSAAGPLRIAKVCDPSRIAREVTELVARARAERAQAMQDQAVVDAKQEGTANARIRVHADQSTVCQLQNAQKASPVVSVIVPLFNTHEFVDQTLASLREQTLLSDVGPKGLEVLVVDDGSTRPETIASIEKIERAAASECAFVLRVLREPHRGLSGTRNAGLRAARGQFVMPVDSDDMLEPTTLTKLYGALLRDPLAAYSTAYLRHFRDLPAEAVGGWIALGNDDELLPVINAGSNAAMMMRRELLLQAGGYDEELPAYEDWDLCCTFADMGLRGIVVPEFLILYRLRDNSMMHGIDRIKHERLRARLLAKHSSLSTNPGRTLRLLLGDTVDMGMLLHERGVSATSMVEDKRVFEAATIMLHENLRYRIADRLNSAAKKLGVQRVVKEFVRKVGGDSPK